jgi:hypothetical protein
VASDHQTQPSVSALAREHGISRATVRRRLANGWQPPITIEGEIVKSNQEVATLGQGLATTLASPMAAPAIPATPDGHPWPPYASAPGRGWRAVGRGTVGLAIITTGAWIAYTSMRGNAWFGRSLTRRLGDGRATPGDLKLAERLIMALVDRLSADSGIEV